MVKNSGVNSGGGGGDVDTEDLKGYSLSVYLFY